MNFYKNPIILGADPFILMHEGKYYLYSTSAPTEGYLVFESDNLTHWVNKGFCLKKGDVKGEVIERNGEVQGFWAPEVIYYKEKFYMVYTVDHHIGIAVSDSPLGPFVQEEKKWIVEETAIDGSFLVDGENVYLYYRHIEKNRLVGVKMSDDLMSVDMSTFSILITPGEFAWEEAEKGVIGTEGPFVLKHNGKYYMTYSANDFRSHEYAIGCAVSESPLGTYTKFVGNPILKKSETVFGTGHHSFTTSKDGKTLICVYHCHYSAAKVLPRWVCIDKAEFVTDENGEDILVIHGPTDCEMPSLA